MATDDLDNTQSNNIPHEPRSMYINYINDQLIRGVDPVADEIPALLYTTSIAPLTTVWKAAGYDVRASYGPNDMYATNKFRVLASKVAHESLTSFREFDRRILDACLATKALKYFNPELYFDIPDAYLNLTVGNHIYPMQLQAHFNLQGVSVDVSPTSLSKLNFEVKTPRVLHYLNLIEVLAHIETDLPEAVKEQLEPGINLMVVRKSLGEIPEKFKTPASNYIAEAQDYIQRTGHLNGMIQMDMPGLGYQLISRDPETGKFFATEPEPLRADISATGVRIIVPNFPFKK